jgi:hypothetical protein
MARMAPPPRPPNATIVEDHLILDKVVKINIRG